MIKNVAFVALRFGGFYKSKEGKYLLRVSYFMHPQLYFINARNAKELRVASLLIFVSN